jgi:3-phosphoshikimate 1-carboxyvinyltransferase
MNLHIIPGHSLGGTCQVPGDKSISHRAALIGALANGVTEISNFQVGADCRSTLHCLRELGVQIERSEELVRVTGCGLRGLSEPDDVLDVGNSGTTTRLLLGILAGQEFMSVITGDGSLRSRPMGRVVEPLNLMGACIMGRSRGLMAPLAIQGTADLNSLTWRLPVASAQVKSAILLAGLHASGITSVVQPVPSRDHTERMLLAFGAAITVDRLTVRIEGGTQLQGQKVRVPGDISAAAFIMVAASLLPGSEVVIRDVGVNPTRTGVIDILRQMGANIEVSNERTWSGEPVADLTVKSAPLHGVSIQGEIIPRLIDEVPVLAVAAAAARGTTEISNCAELRVKETDRLEAMTKELQKMGAQVRQKDGGLVIRGGALHGAPMSSWRDHRVGMSMVVAGLLADSPSQVDNLDCVDISYPGFTENMQQLGAVLETGYGQ